MAMTVAFAAVATSVDAEDNDYNANMGLDDTFIPVEGSTKATINFDYLGSGTNVNIKYTASLKDSKGNVQSNGVSPSSGTLTDGGDQTLTVKAPKADGKYTIVVDYEYTVDGTKKTAQSTAIIKVVPKITLTAKIVNDSDSDLKMSVDFYVDGSDKPVNDTPVEVEVHAGHTESAKFDYAPESIAKGKHTYTVKVNEGSVGYGVVDLSGDYSFYVGQTSYSLITSILITLFVVLLIVGIWVFRKPIRNYGKPKSRR